MRRLITALAALSLIALAACQSSTPAGQQSGQQQNQTITVFAAASLQETFTALAQEYEKQHPGTTVTLSFGGSSSLAQQIVSGAPVDVFAAASEETMATATKAGKVASPQMFASNRLTIAVPNGNPAKIAQLADLAKPGVKLAVCAPAVPCGAATVKVAGNAKLELKPVTQEQDVKAVLTKVQLGEVDAGLVYVTDVAASGLPSVQIPDDVNAITRYPIGIVSGGPNATGGQAFLDYVRSSAGLEVLKKAGFGAP